MLKRAAINVLAALVVLASTPTFAQLACDGQHSFVGGASPDSGARYSSQLSWAATISIGALAQSEYLGQLANLYVACETAGECTQRDFAEDLPRRGRIGW